jgi:hypothetical protein
MNGRWWANGSIKKSVEQSCGCAMWFAGDLGVHLVRLNEVRAEPAAELRRDFATRAEGEGVAMDGELEDDVLLRTAQPSLGAGNMALAAARGAARADKVVGIFARASKEGCKRAWLEWACCRRRGYQGSNGEAQRISGPIARWQTKLS